MKKNLAAVLAILCLLVLSGCGDASANVSNKNDVIFQIGKTKVTKGDLYHDMLNSDQGLSIINLAKDYIIEKEVETTEEMKQAAQKIIDDYKEQLGEDFEESLHKAGYENEEEFFNLCLADVKSDYLIDAYIAEKWDELVAQYAPKKIKVMDFKSDDDTPVDKCYENATAAINAIKKGESFEEVAERFGCDEALVEEQLCVTNDKNFDVNLIQALATVTSPTLSDVIVSSDAKGYYIAQVTSTNIEQMKDEFIEYIKKVDGIEDAMNSYYFKKHNFTIYDIDVFNLIKTNYKNYLVQD